MKNKKLQWVYRLLRKWHNNMVACIQTKIIKLL